jgi:predicted transcriptional regulator of viral defense system
MIGNRSVKTVVFEFIASRTEPFSADHIAWSCRLPKRNVGQALSVLAREGKIRRVSRGVYRAGGAA